MEAGLIGELGIGCHHHVGGGVGLGQAGFPHQSPEIGCGTHSQLALALPFPQLGLAALRQLSGRGPCAHGGSPGTAWKGFR